jgi:hypothetical protein
MNEYIFHEVAINEILYLRNMQTKDLKGQIFDSLDEHIELADVVCIQINFINEVIGYAIIDDKDDAGIFLLEFYIVLKHRKNAKYIMGKLIDRYHCCQWFVNTQDSFALPLMVESGFSYSLDGLIFSAIPLQYLGDISQDGVKIEIAITAELNDIYDLVMQDGFYSGGGVDALANCIEDKEIYLLRLQEKIIGAGFVSPLLRTPKYADIAYIIDKKHRQKGYATALVKVLIHISLKNGLIPTALTSPTNKASRKTLEKCGFYLDGCMIIATLNGDLN